MWKGWNIFETVSKPKTRPHIRLLFWDAKVVQSKKHELQELLLLERIAVCTINETHLFSNVVLNLCNFGTYRQDILIPRPGRDCLSETEHSTLFYIYASSTKCQGSRSFPSMPDQMPVSVITVYKLPWNYFRPTIWMPSLVAPLLLLCAGS
ncbi:hypothetical protein Zmor_009010 [Zophobas morio]|uniref:Uncharacterized protein n=1 Tax=Zophobas morio TaxID=2755281 RepID=A0AA38HHK2_9CUCU|nr:hypothetical protein Zmor_009010 [Zophobas morio]